MRQHWLTSIIRTSRQGAESGCHPRADSQPPVQPIFFVYLLKLIGIYPLRMTAVSQNPVGENFKKRLFLKLKQ